MTALRRNSGATDECRSLAPVRGTGAAAVRLATRSRGLRRIYRLRPVTPEAAGSSPVDPANFSQSDQQVNPVRHGHGAPRGASESLSFTDTATDTPQQSGQEAGDLRGRAE
jgi:hypothetical protein